MKWNIDGEVISSCNCDVFCPCVLSLGKAAPTFGYCHSWWGINIIKGEADGRKLDGLKAGLLLDVPAKMGDGGWAVALYIDDKADAETQTALTQILTGQAGGSLAVLAVLVERVLGVQQAALTFDKTADGWRMLANADDKKIADVAIARQTGANPDEAVEIRNSQYWVASDVTVAVSGKSKVRAFGRNWDFTGQSAEYAKVSWCGES